MANSPISDVGKFLGRHAQELGTITSLVRTLTPALGLGAAERTTVERLLGVLDTASSNIAKSVPNFKEVKVTVKKSDVEAAIAPRLAAMEAKLDDLVAAAVAKALAAQKEGDA